METERTCPSCGKALPTGVPLGLCPECLIKSGFPTGTGPGAASPPGGGFVPPPVEELAKLFPQFEIIQFIGKGGMGAVYKARQPALDRFVALKVLPPVVANDPGFAERFNREARALARLNHPNIVTVYDFGKAGELHYLVMEFVDGANLREVERAGKLTSEQALAIVPQICEALQFAHNEGIVHRDIKPENLLMDKKGRVKITDFGIAKIMGVTEGKVSLTGARDVVGTPHYMAPEQVEKPQTVDHRADIYSLGVVFYEMLTGELPLGKFSPPSKKVQVDVRLDEVVLHTLEKEPERRYQQASQVKKDVETITTTRQPPTLGGVATPGAIPPPAPPQHDGSSDKIILPAFLLAFFFGIFGAHRFYVGKIGTGILQLLTFGGMGIWATIDWILILCKAFTDKQGRRLTRWWHVSGPSGSAPGPAAPAPPPRPGAPPKIAPVSRVGDAAIIVPAIALLVAGFWKLFWGLAVLSRAAFGHTGEIYHLSYLRLIPFARPPVAGVMGMLLYIIPALAIIYGAVEMLRLRRYGWAVVSAIVAMMFCSVIGVPAGIWALIVLLLPGTRQAFGGSRPTTENWQWILGITGAATLIIAPIISLQPSHHRAASSFAQTAQAQATSWPPAPASPFVQHVQPMQPMQPVQAMQPLKPLSPSERVRLNQLQAKLNKANAMLEGAETRYRAGHASERDVQLARDKQKLLTAQQLLEFQTLGYEQGDVTRDAYLQDQLDVSNLQTQLDADESGTTATVSGSAPAPDVTSGNPPATVTVTPAGTTHWSYQWYSSNPNAPTEVSNALNTAASALTLAISNVAIPVANALEQNGYVAGTNLTATLQSQLAEAQQQLAEAQKQIQASYTTNVPAANRDAMAKIQAQIKETQLMIQKEAADNQGGQIPSADLQRMRDQITASESQLINTEVALQHESQQVAGITPVTGEGATDIGDTLDFITAFKVTPGGELTMNVDRGDIQVNGADQETVTIRVKRSVTGASDADATEILKEEHVTLRQSANTISIRAQEPEALHRGGFFAFNNPNLNAHYEITVPKKFLVEAQTAGGNMNVRDIHGSLNMQTSGGGIFCEDIEGGIDADTSGGDVSIHQCNGPVKAGTSGGNVTIDDFRGPDVLASTSAGSVSVIFLSTPTADSDLRTSGGDVTLRLPGDSQVSLDASTEGGSVTTDLPVTGQGTLSNDTLKGTINGGGPLIRLQTEGGDIVVSKN
jgi:predicted Ser/Thr protein kinase